MGGWDLGTQRAAQELGVYGYWGYVTQGTRGIVEARGLLAGTMAVEYRGLRIPAKLRV